MKAYISGWKWMTESVGKRTTLKCKHWVCAYPLQKWERLITLLNLCFSHLCVDTRFPPCLLEAKGNIHTVIKGPWEVWRMQERQNEHWWLCCHLCFPESSAVVTPTSDPLREWVSKWINERSHRGASDTVYFLNLSTVFSIVIRAQSSRSFRRNLTCKLHLAIAVITLCTSKNHSPQMEAPLLAGTLWLRCLHLGYLYSYFNIHRRLVKKRRL